MTAEELALAAFDTETGKRHVERHMRGYLLSEIAGDRLDVVVDTLDNSPDRGHHAANAEYDQLDQADRDALQLASMEEVQRLEYIAARELLSTCRSLNITGTEDINADYVALIAALPVDWSQLDQRRRAAA